MNNTLYTGDLERPSRRKGAIGETDRVTIRLSQLIFENLSALAYALDVTPSRAAAILLEESLRNSNFVNAYIKEYLMEHLDDRRMKELMKVLRFINTSNPYDEEVSWFAIVSVLFKEVKHGIHTFTDTVDEFLEKWK